MSVYRIVSEVKLKVLFGGHIILKMYLSKKWGSEIFTAHGLGWARIGIIDNRKIEYEGYQTIGY